MESEAVYYIAIAKVLIEGNVYNIKVTPLPVTQIFRTLQLESSDQNLFGTVPADSRSTKMTTNLLARWHDELALCGQGLSLSGWWR